MSEQIKIGGRLHSIAEGNVATGANEILDDTKGKKQNVINQETDAELERLENAKQDNLTFDTTPTEGSTNPITSGGVFAADAEIQQAIEAILLLIPSAASALNQLADKAFVNSTVATNTATFRGTYNVVTDLELHYDATHQQIATALLSKIQTADNNDYCFVQIPVSDSSGDIRVTERYKFNGMAWSYEYDLNNSGFTAAQWAAINSTITQALVEKLGALPTAAELAIALNGKQNTLTFDSTPTAGSSNPVTSAGLYAAFAAINATIPAGASADNKLVAETRLAEYVAAIINALDATYNVTSTDGHVNVRLTQVDGAITSLEVLTNDIASAADVTALTIRISTNEGDIAQLQAAYEALTQSTPEIIEPTDTWPVAAPQEGVIYRVIDRVNTPPQNYSDYMYNGTAMVLMATYDNAIDDIPTPGSNNLVKSGGVASHIVYDISEANAVGSTLATYADLAAALGNNGANIPPSIRKGGMSVKFVLSSDNKYVQFRCMTQNFATDVTQWQGVDDEPTAGSDNLMNSYGTNTSIQKERGTVFEIGGINVDTGQELVNAAQLRSSLIFPDKDGNISIHCDFPLALRALLLYNEKGVYESKIYAGTSYSDYTYNSSGKPVRGIFVRTYGTNIQTNDYKSITVNGYASLISKMHDFEGKIGAKFGLTDIEIGDAAYEIGTLNVQNGEESASDTALRTGFLTKEDDNADMVITTSSLLYIRAICEYKMDGTFIQSLFTPENKTTYTYTGNNSIRIVFIRRTSPVNVSLDDISDITYSNRKIGLLELIDSNKNEVEEEIDNIVNCDLEFDYEIGSINLQNGDEVDNPTAIRTGLLFPQNGKIVITTSSELYIRGIGKYNPDGTWNSQEYAGVNYETYTYNGTLPIRIVFITRNGGASNLGMASGIQYSLVEGLQQQINELQVLKGKTLIVTGDSIPHGQVFDGAAPSKPYPLLVADALGMTLKNYAIGGSTFAQASNFGGTFGSYADFVAAEKDTSKLYVVLTGNQTYQNYKYSDGSWVVTTAGVDDTRTPISSRYQYMDDGDIVLVHCGTNDFQYNWTDVGTMADRTPDTFYGALHYTILGLLQKYLTKSIIFCTPIKRAQSPYTSQTSANAKGKTLSDYADMIKEVCKYYSIPVIDLYSESLLNPEIASQASLFDSYKTHPLQAGHNMLAKVVAGKVKSFNGISV